MTLANVNKRLDELLRTVVTNAPVVLFAFDTEGRFILSEGRALTALGLKPGEIVGRSVFEVFFLTTQIEEEARRALAGEEVTSITKTMGLTYEVRYMPVFGDNKQVTSVIGVATDITEPERTEEHLKVRNQAIDASSSGICIADAQKPDMPLIYVNRGFEMMTGYRADEVVGLNCRFLQGDDREQPQLDDLRAAMKAGQGVTVVLRNYRKNGTLFWNEITLTPVFDTEGRLTYFTGIQTDVTERELAEKRIQAQNAALVKANEDLVEARKRAEEATRLKTQFLATMSHELRTPLNAIIGYTEILLAGMTGSLNDEQTDYHQRVLANAENLMQLIDNLLDISKIEAGRMDIIQKPFNLREWLEVIGTQVSGLAAQKGLSFDIFVDDTLPQVVVGDPIRIRQIVLNLLSNAIKFTDRGVVKLEIRRQGSDIWCITVSDTGIGIPPHMQETIFEEFRQADSSSRRTHSGTGLGLAIVRKLAVIMGGSIRLSSIVGEGSTFTVSLPLITTKDPVTQNMEV